MVLFQSSAVKQEEGHGTQPTLNCVTFICYVNTMHRTHLLAMIYSSDFGRECILSKGFHRPRLKMNQFSLLKIRKQTELCLIGTE